jgi:hypothetical protein
MAKKKPAATNSTTTTKKRGASAGKPAKKSPPASPPHDHDLHDDQDEETIELDDTERKAIDRVVGSKKMCTALETEVNTAVTQAVRRVCKAHGTVLTAAQAQNVAMVLFGD